MQTTDVQAAISELSKSIFEINSAFQTLAAYLLPKMAAGGLLSLEELASDLEGMAIESGRLRAAVGAGGSEPNLQLIGLAKGIRARISGEEIPPLRLVRDDG